MCRTGQIGAEKACPEQKRLAVRLAVRPLSAVWGAIGIRGRNSGADSGPLQPFGMMRFGYLLAGTVAQPRAIRRGRRWPDAAPGAIDEERQRPVRRLVSRLVSPGPSRGGHARRDRRGTVCASSAAELAIGNLAVGVSAPVAAVAPPPDCCGSPRLITLPPRFYAAVCKLLKTSGLFAASVI